MTTKAIRSHYSALRSRAYATLSLRYTDGSPSDLTIRCDHDFAALRAAGDAALAAAMAAYPAAVRAEAAARSALTDPPDMIGSDYRCLWRIPAGAAPAVRAAAQAAADVVLAESRDLFEHYADAVAQGVAQEPAQG